jgi:copper chaperone NosL
MRATIAAGLLRNSRKTDTLPAAKSDEFLFCLAPLAAAFALLTLLTACRFHSPRPVEIEPSDMCEHCRMAISRKQFAAEILDADENAAKFDDIGCMLRYLDKGEHKPTALFVVDYTNRQWLDAKAALFVRGSKVATPMGGGILAFGGRARAEAAAREYGGAVFEFAQLPKP